jgi:serine/threonine-protein kinase
MLNSGDRLSNYEIIEPIGTGGFGEVFRARDARLGRDVAIKVLSERFLVDAKRLQAFEREAQVLASLNHPNIATLHAIEPLGDTQALVLELVEGETLAERIARGPLPLAEVLRIARQVAAGLAAAHERGVVHRDLKPSNVKLRPDGTVKLLDFGLAKITEAQPAGADPAEVTVTMARAPGTFMGTPACMSPEQVRGLPVDRRTDIWAFGCLLYQMLAGVAPFRAEHASDVLAKIIEREPDYTLLPASTPRAVRNVLSRCLRKDPRDRLRDIADARLYLEESGLPEATGSGTRRSVVAAGMAVLAGLAVVATLLLRERTPPAAQQALPPVVRYSIPARLTNDWGGQTFAISPDGSRFAWTSPEGLTVRARDTLESVDVPVRNKTYVMAPFFSPDGRSIGYVDGSDLFSVPVQGGQSVELAHTGPAAMGHWSEAGIVIASMNGLSRIPADGGNAEPVSATLGKTEQAVFPQMLPGGRALLFTVLPVRRNTVSGVSDGPDVRVEALDLASGEQSTLLRGGGHAWYVPSGHLLYVTGTTLNAVAFDAASLLVRGPPVAMVTGVRNAEYAVAGDGTLVYRSGGALEESTLVWVDRWGREQPIDAPARRYNYARLSPDGRRVALDMHDATGNRDIFLWDLERRRLDRLSSNDPAGKALVAWSPDGQTLAYGSARYGVTTPLLQSLDASAEPQRLVENEQLQLPMAFLPDGRLLVSADVPGRRRDVVALALDGSGNEKPIVHGPGNDLNAEVSPDGRWIVYESDESGQYELYVRPYPDAYAGASRQITSEGGRHPLWSHDGRELFFCTYDGDLWALPVKPGARFDYGPPVRLLDNTAATGYLCGGRTTSGRPYDVTADGRKFLMIKSGESPPGAGKDGLVVVLNFFEELKKAVH